MKSYFACILLFFVFFHESMSATKEQEVALDKIVTSSEWAKLKDISYKPPGKKMRVSWPVVIEYYAGPDCGECNHKCFVMATILMHSKYVFVLKELFSYLIDISEKCLKLDQSLRNDVIVRCFEVHHIILKESHRMVEIFLSASDFMYYENSSRIHDVLFEIEQFLSSIPEQLEVYDENGMRINDYFQEGDNGELDEPAFKRIADLERVIHFRYRKFLEHFNDVLNKFVKAYKCERQMTIDTESDLDFTAVYFINQFLRQGQDDHRGPLSQDTLAFLHQTLLDVYAKGIQNNYNDLGFVFNSVTKKTKMI